TRAEFKHGGVLDLEATRERGVDDQVAAVRLQCAGIIENTGRVDGQGAAGDVDRAGVGDISTGDEAVAGRIQDAGDSDRAAIDRGPLQIERRSMRRISIDLDDTLRGAVSIGDD